MVHKGVSKFNDVGVYFKPGLGSGKYGHGVFDGKGDRGGAIAEARGGDFNVKRSNEVVHMHRTSLRLS
jgi:hypothetical protein